jgi:hypothetical protein
MSKPVLEASIFFNLKKMTALGSCVGPLKYNNFVVIISVRVHIYHKKN